jgi:site-specific recombinase XerD
MLTDYLRDSRALERLQSGPAGPFVDDFVRHLETEGAAPKTIHNHLGALGHFSRWAAPLGLGLSDLDAVAWQRFEEHEASCRCFGSPLQAGGRLVQRTRRFVEFARGLSGAVPALPPRARHAGPPLFVEFRCWMLERGVGVATLKGYGWTVRRLLRELGEVADRYDAEGLRRFLDGMAEGHKPKTRENIRGALRSFLRYLEREGRITAGLEDQVLGLSPWRRHQQGIAQGLLAPYLDGFLDGLRDAGLAPSTVELYRSGVARFNHWATGSERPLAELDDSALEAFRDHVERTRGRDGDLAYAVRPARRLLEYLRERGVARGVNSRRPASAMPALVQEFADWMTRQRGLRPATLENYSRSLREFVAVLGKEPQGYEVSGLRSFLLSYQQRHGRRCAQHAVTALRGFLRFLGATGRCSPSLAEAIPPVANWRLASLPRYLPAEDVARVLAACDGSSPAALRDRAVLLLLARLSLRRGDVVRLELRAIDWEAGTLRLVGKGRREATLPLTQEVGEALAAYVERGRPRAPFEEVFLGTRPPVRPFEGYHVSALVAKYIGRAGVKAPSRGAHVLRHSAATELLRQGASLDEIGALLRHRFRDTTAIYAKVDVALLQLVAQPWPEVSSC